VDEIIALATMVHDVAPEVSVILQPVTIQDRVEMTAAQLLVLQTAVARIHADVRVIPQTHAFLGVL
jgi:organic radical activating enzyme